MLNCGVHNHPVKHKKVLHTGYGNIDYMLIMKQVQQKLTSQLVVPSSLVFRKFLLLIPLAKVSRK